MRVALAASSQQQHCCSAIPTVPLRGCHVIDSCMPAMPALEAVRLYAPVKLANPQLHSVALAAAQQQ
jgi:hypothetical protein